MQEDTQLENVDDTTVEDKPVVKKRGRPFIDKTDPKWIENQKKLEAKRNHRKYMRRKQSRKTTVKTQDAKLAENLTLDASSYSKPNPYISDADIDALVTKHNQFKPSKTEEQEVDNIFEDWNTPQSIPETGYQPSEPILSEADSEWDVPEVKSNTKQTIKDEPEDVEYNNEPIKTQYIPKTQPKYTPPPNVSKKQTEGGQKILGGLPPYGLTVSTPIDLSGKAIEPASVIESLYTKYGYFILAEQMIPNQVFPIKLIQIKLDDGRFVNLFFKI